MTMKIIVDGTTVTAQAASTRIVIPNDSTGSTARTIRVSATGSAHILPGDSTVVATTDSPLVAASGPLTIDVIGLSNIAILESDTAPLVNVTPLES